MSTPGVALHDLRTVVIVLAVHAVLAYLGSSPASSFNFDDPPFRWRSIPILDSERWLGFDKAMIVLSGTLLMSWASVAALRRIAARAWINRSWRRLAT